MPRPLLALIAINLALLFAVAVYLLGEKRDSTHLGIDRIAEFLNAQEACDELAERYARTDDPADLSRVEACERRLERSRGETRWRR